jgi:hypothetical protein
MRCNHIMGPAQVSEKNLQDSFESLTDQISGKYEKISYLQAHVRENEVVRWTHVVWLAKVPENTLKIPLSLSKIFQNTSR